MLRIDSSSSSTEKTQLETLYSPNEASLRVIKDHKDRNSRKVELSS
jgi:hypothetical protein